MDELNRKIAENWATMTTRIQTAFEELSQPVYILKEEELTVEEQSSYKIYLTRSQDAATLIAKGLMDSEPWSKRDGKMLKTSTGCLYNDERIPAIYHSKGYYYALIEYRNGEDYSSPEYRVIVC